MISWDGAQASLVYDLINKGELPNFARLVENGVRAEYAQSVDPSLTTTAHNSISTGSYPARTGIVSNSFHNLADSFYWYRRGFDEMLDQAEPVWVTASRAGLTSAALFFIGGSPAFPSQTADLTIGYGIRDAYSAQQTVSLAPVENEWSGDLPRSYSTPYEGSYSIREVARVHLYLFDSSDDGVSNYDTVVINRERVVGSNTPQLKTGQWGALVLIPSAVSGADFLIQEIVQDGEAPSEVTFFHSGVYHNTASPRQLLEELNAKFGPFPSGHDYYALEHGWINPEDDIYLTKRAALWMAEVAAWVNETYNPDLVLTWQDVFDAAGHSFSMREPRQFNYSPGAAEMYAGYYQQITQVADQALGIMLGKIDLDTTTLMMVADHGMAPIHSRVYVNTILEKAGLLTLDSRDYVVVNRSAAFAVASGGAVHIYINLEDHEMNGFVTEEEYPLIQTQIIDLLESLTDPETGEKVFQRVLRREELNSLHLDHPNSGDIFAQANLGYHLDGWRGKKIIFEQANFYGQHGYDSSLPEMHTIFIASGASIPTSGGVIPPIRVVDYAPTIAALLGFPPANTVDGRAIPALVGSP